MHDMTSASSVTWRATRIRVSEDAGREVTTCPLVMTEPGTHGEPGSLHVGHERDGTTDEGAATRNAEDLARVEGPWQ